MMFGLQKRHSVLRWRIVIFNILVFLILVGGMIAIQSSREGLVDERLTGIEEEAKVVAGTLAEYATVNDTRSINVEDAAPLMRELLAPTRLRARLYDTNGQLIIDTRNLLARNIVQVSQLPPIDSWSRFKRSINQIYDGIIGVRPYAKLAPYYEAGKDGRVYREVREALEGTDGHAERVDEQNRLVLSVAVPIQRFKAVYGALFVTTEGGDIDNILREERTKLIQYLAVALAVMLGSALWLSHTIAEPMRKLAEAADRVRSGLSGRDTIPSMSERGDEIGDLAESLSAMTRALYDRIDAIESFAADVAHELKNPLTSLKSAVEMFSRAADEESRNRLMSIVRTDVKRIDRLITDISDASRLDAELSREARSPVDIARLLETIVEIYRFMELPNNVGLKLDLQLPPDAAVMGRDERIGQVFRNLIDNAISFSPDGGTVTVSGRTDTGLVRVTVDDEGPGIPPDNLETIFERFYTERPQDHDFGKNSGLGLSIARQIANGMGGRIWAENRKTGGARFIVELPLAGLAWQA